LNSGELVSWRRGRSCGCWGRVGHDRCLQQIGDGNILNKSLGSAGGSLDDQESGGGNLADKSLEEVVSGDKVGLTVELERYTNIKNEGY